MKPLLKCVLRSCFLFLYPPPPPINKVFSVVLQEECQREITITSPVDSITLLSKQVHGSPQQFSPRGKEHPQCSHCGNLGHTVDKCYKLIGYPSSYRTKNRFSTSTANVVGYGSTDSNYADGLFKPVAPPVMTTPPSSLPFTTEQCQQLLSLLNNQSAHPKGSTSSATTLAANLVHSHNELGGNCPPPSSFSSSSPIWIIDTSASNHMTNSISLFSSNIRKCQSHVSLPDGKSASISHIGTIHLFPSLVLKNVLCVLSFHFNLISASKLSPNLHCLLVIL